MRRIIRPVAIILHTIDENTDIYRQPDKGLFSVNSLILPQPDSTDHDGVISFYGLSQCPLLS